jgi:hypothetical protein
MADESLVVTELRVELDNYRRGMTEAGKLAATLERQLAALIQAAGGATAALNRVNARKIVIGVDSSALTQAAAEARALDGLSPRVSIVVDAGQIEGALSQARALDGLSTRLDVQVDAGQVIEAQTQVRALDGLNPAVNVVADAASLQAVASDVRALDGLSPEITVDVQADTSEAETTLGALEVPDLRAMVDVDTSELENAQRLIDDIDAMTPTVDIAVTADTETARTKISNEARRTPTVTIDVRADTSSAESKLDDLSRQLDDLKKGGKIQLTFDVGQLPGMIGGAAGAAGGIFGTFATPILEADAALQRLRGTTDAFIPDADRLISDIFTNGWGESRAEVAAAISAFTQLGRESTDLEGDISSTFAAAQVGGKDFTEVLAAADRLVSSGLVGSIREANDLLATGFRAGGDRAGDLVDTFVEYSSQFAQIGIDGPAALSLINQGLEAGTFNSDKLADTFKELNVRITEAVATGEGATAEALGRVGLADEAEAFAAGEITALEFARGAQEALASGAATEFDLYEIFGSPLEDFGVDIFAGLDFTAAENAIIPEGTAQQAASTINDTLNQTLLETGRIIEDSVLAKFGGLEGLLDRINEKAGEFNDLLRGGADIPDALEIVLETPGLADTLRSFEAALGNFVIELLTGIANVLQGLGQTGAATDVRREVTRLSEQQLTFDLQTAKTETDAANAVQRAIRRGVEEAATEGAVATAIEEMLSKGNVAAAADLVETIEGIPPATLPVEFFKGGEFQRIEIPVDIAPSASPEAIQQAADEALSAAMVAQDFDLGGGGSVGAIRFNPQFDVSGSEAQVQAAVTALADQARAALASGDTVQAIQLFQEAGQEEAAREAGARLATEFTQAFIAGDFSGGLLSQYQALQSVDIEPFLPGIEFSETMIREQLQTAFAEAVETADLSTASAIAADLGDEGMIAQVDDLRASTELMVGEAGNFSQTLLDMATNQGEATSAMQTMTAEGVTPANDAILILTTATEGYFAGLVDQIEIAKVTWDEYATFVSELSIEPPSVSTGAATTPTASAFAEGGIARGVSLVGEAGPELISPNTAMAVLNNTTTQAILAGVQMAIAGAGSTSTTTININVLNNNANPAAAIAGSDRLSNQLRGFAQ